MTQEDAKIVRLVVTVHRWGWKLWMNSTSVMQATIALLALVALSPRIRSQVKDAHPVAIASKEDRHQQLVPQDSMDLTLERKHLLIALNVCQVSIVLVQMLLLRQVSAKKAITAKVALSTTFPMVVEFTLKLVLLSLDSMLPKAQLTRFPVQRAPTMAKKVRKSVSCAPLVSFAINCSLR